MILLGCAAKMGAKSTLVLSVRIQRYRPIIMLNMAQMVTIYPPSLSHILAGVMIPGSVNKKVMKIMTAFTMPAVHSC